MWCWVSQLIKYRHINRIAIHGHFHSRLLWQLLKYCFYGTVGTLQWLTLWIVGEHILNWKVTVHELNRNSVPTPYLVIWIKFKSVLPHVVLSYKTLLHEMFRFHRSVWKLPAQNIFSSGAAGRQRLAGWARGWTSSSWTSWTSWGISPPSLSVTPPWTRTRSLKADQRSKDVLYSCESCFEM